MVYLLLAIVCGTCISFVLRLEEDYVKEQNGVLTINYTVCFLLACFFGRTSEVVSNISGRKEALLIGAVSGILYFGGFKLFQWNIKKNGVVLTTTFMKLGILVPTVISLILFREYPGMIQAIGLLIAFFAIIWMSIEKNEKKAENGLGLILLLLIGGSADAMGKIFDQFSNPVYKNQYLAYTFASALLLCFIFQAKRKEKIERNEVLFGILLGIPNYFSVRCLLFSLKSVPAIIVYPTYSVGVIILVCVTGVLIFREKLSIKQKRGIALILVACFCLNI